MLSYCKRIAGTFQRFFFARLYDDMDGVYIVSAATRPRPLFRSVPTKFGLNLRHAPAFILYFLYFLQLFYQLAVYHFDLNQIPGETTFARKILPGGLGKRADIFLLDIGAMLLVLAGLWLFHDLRPFERKWRMLALVRKDGTLVEMLQKGQVMNRSEAEAIYGLSRKAKKAIEALLAIIYLEAQSFYLLNLWANWRESLMDYLTLLWMIPYIPSAVMHIYASIFAFLLNVHYLRLKQRFQMAALRRINARMSQIGGKGEAEARLEAVRLFDHFLSVNRRLVSLHGEILAYSSFWSSYLSANFASLSFLVTYFAFLLYKPTKGESLAMSLFLAVFACLVFAMLLGITLECSGILRNHRQTVKLQRKVTLHAKKRGAMRFNVLEKFDKIEADSPSREKIGFQLFASLKINSRMFELLLFYISSLFMKIVQNEV